MSIKENKKGFTLVELLAVIVVLAVVILIAVTAVIPRMNNAKKKALVDEALVYLKAAKEAYSFDPQLLNASSCTNITDLNGKYVKKDSDNYKGAIKTTYTDGVVSQTIYLTDGKFYVSGSDTITSDNVSDEKPAGFLNSCGDYNPVLADNVDTDSLAYKFFTINGALTKEQSLSAFEQRTNDKSFASGIYKSEDNYGAVFKNSGDYRWGGESQYVVFGGFCWNIATINGDGSLRLLYDSVYSSSGCGGTSEGSITTVPIPFAQTKTETVTVDDVSGLTNNKVQTTFTNYSDSIQYGGYMYNPSGVMAYYPELEFNLTSMTRFIQSPKLISDNDEKFYVFSSNDLNKTCSNLTQDGTQVCTFTCRSLGDDCLYASINELKNASNLVGVPANESWLFTYDNPKYFCSGGSSPVLVENSDQTTSVYMSCTSFYELAGNISRASVWLRKHYFAPESTEALNNGNKDSYVKQFVDNWYENNIYGLKDENDNYLEDYIVDQIFCSKKTVDNNKITYSNYSVNSDPLSYIYFVKNRAPSLKCSVEDSYTLSDNSTSRVSASAVGNKKLKYPIGLPSYEDTRNPFAKNSNNYYYMLNFYFAGGKTFWTMSRDYSSLKLGLQYPGSTNVMVTTGANQSLSALDSAHIKPVINIRGDVKVVSGSGLFMNPYIMTLPSE